MLRMFYCVSVFRNTATYAALTPKSSRNAIAVRVSNTVELYSLFFLRYATPFLAIYFFCTIQFHFLQRAMKQEAVLAGHMNDQKTPVRPPPASRQCVPKLQTPMKVAHILVLNIYTIALYFFCDIFVLQVDKYPPITTSFNNTPKR